MLSIYKLLLKRKRKLRYGLGNETLKESKIRR
jgi:hypothetical protein